ncbi:hypothetical protein ACIU1J_23375 [Azospirillum doebereinerae]|uniref:hypothetical protein n=1 Tax=Azospirillum doebereinerae TaxID=92933 RepID=UPI001EE6042A|nr:hypothetical protein [Azospirillum doebereinerae]MCG5238725.1 hypothetical protein [Azospirillum doebereinerae]
MIMVKPKMESGGARARNSLERALASGVALEVRTTVHPARLDAGALSGLTGDLLGLGVVRPCALQPFHALGCGDASFLAASSPPFSTVQLIGFGTSDSQRLAGIFNAPVTRPENTLRWHWSPGDVAIGGSVRQSTAPSPRSRASRHDLESLDRRLELKPWLRFTLHDDRAISIAMRDVEHHAPVAWPVKFHERIGGHADADASRMRFRNRSR